jgi:hypothetical protein
MSSPIKPTGHSDLDGNAFGQGEEFAGFYQEFGQFFVPPKHHIPLLKIGGELHGDEGIYPGVPT